MSVIIVPSSDLVWLWRMEATPDTTRRLGCADDRLPLERHDLRSRGVEEKLDLLRDLVDLKTLQPNDFVTVVHFANPLSAILSEQMKRGTYDNNL